MRVSDPQSAFSTSGYRKRVAFDSDAAMPSLTCHCRRVSLQTTRRPDFIHECNCSLCQKTGAIWGYFAPDEVATDGETSSYCRSDKSEPGVDVHFCANCGATTHFKLTEAAKEKHGDTMMGVNMRLADAQDLHGIELRFPDGRAWSGVGEFGYVRAARIID